MPTTRNAEIFHAHTFGASDLELAKKFGLSTGRINVIIDQERDRQEKLKLAAEFDDWCDRPIETCLELPIRARSVPKYLGYHTLGSIAQAIQCGELDLDAITHKGDPIINFGKQSAAHLKSLIDDMQTSNAPLHG